MDPAIWIDLLVTS